MRTFLHSVENKPAQILMNAASQLSSKSSGKLTGTMAQVACTPSAGFNQCVRVTYSGGDQNFTVPAGISSLKVTIWGGGGGYTNLDNLAVTPGQLLTVRVGQGGLTSSMVTTYGGGGAGGRSGTLGVPNRMGSSGGGGGASYSL